MLIFATIQKDWPTEWAFPAYRLVVGLKGRTRSCLYSINIVLEFETAMLRKNKGILASKFSGSAMGALMVMPAESKETID